MKKQIIAIAATTMIGGGLFGTAASAQTYTVKSGDTLWGISQNNNTTVQQVKSLNNLSSDLIFPNQKLEVGGSAATASAASNGNGTYTVQPGDTLFKIASKNGLSVQSLKAINGLSSDRIYAGEKLSLSGQVKGVATSRPAAAAKAASAPAQETQQAPQGKTISVSATAYTAKCEGCSGITATGINLNANPNAKVIAVDPNVIPLGSKVHVEGYGTAVAGDTGGAIKGNRIDIHVPTTSQALDWGRRTVNVTILN